MIFFSKEVTRFRFPRLRHFPQFHEPRPLVPLRPAILSQVPQTLLRPAASPSLPRLPLAAAHISRRCPARQAHLPRGPAGGGVGVRTDQAPAVAAGGRGGGGPAERRLPPNPQALAPWGAPGRTPRQEARQPHKQQLLRGPGLNPALGGRGRGSQDWEKRQKWGAEGGAASVQVRRTASGAPRDATARMPLPGLTPAAPLPARRALQARTHWPRLARRLVAGALGAPGFVLPAAGVHLV